MSLFVENALADRRFAQNPFVKGDPMIRFYAGAPLTTSDGYALGMICVIAPVVRTLESGASAGLRALGRQVVAQFELLERFRKLSVPVVSGAVPRKIAAPNASTAHNPH